VKVMRATNPDAPRPFRVPAVWLVAPLGIALCLLLMLSLPPENWYRLMGWMALGLAIYFLYGRRNSVLGRQAGGAV
jgi:APA family basic amino acid/polyamine antiporter